MRHGYIDTSELFICVLCLVWVYSCYFARNRTSLYIDCDALCEREQMRGKNSFHVTLDFPIYRIMCVDCVSWFCVASENANAPTCSDCCIIITMDVTLDLSMCVCVCVCMFWYCGDKRVKSISLDWMEMLYKSAIINVKIISKKPKSVFEHTVLCAVAIPQ